MYALLAGRGLAINSPPALPPPTGDIKDLRGAYLALQQKNKQDFPGGAVVENLPASAGDTGSSPGPGRSHMPWSN